MKLSDLKPGDLLIDKEKLNLYSVCRLEKGRAVVLAHDVVLSYLLEWELKELKRPTNKDMVEFISNGIRIYMLLDEVFKNPPKTKHEIKTFGKGI